MNYLALTYATSGEKFYNLTMEIKETLEKLIVGKKNSGILHLFIPHTSCALAISEAFDPAACKDVERFFDHIAPRDLKFITHTDEGEDDSPSHMKSVLLHQNISLIVDNGKLVLGQWQGIYLAEFRDSAHQRKILVKYCPDC